MIESIQKYIAQQLITLTSAEKNNEILALEQLYHLINNLLTESKNGSRIEYLIKTAYHLENALTPHYQEIQKNSLTQKTIHSTPTLNNPVKFSTSLTSSLKQLYQMMMNLPPLKQCAWIYHYPKNHHGYIKNQSITTWIKQLTHPTQHHTYHALTDFKRDINIDNQHAYTNTLVFEYAEKLIKKGDYSHTEQAIILNWFYDNGGQEMNRFLDQCLLDCHIDTQFCEKNTVPTLGRAKAIIQNWCIQNEKLCFEYAINVYSLIYHAKNIAYLDEHEKFHFSDDINKYIETQQKQNKTPLFYINANIQLDLVKNIVKLHMKDFSIMSMTTALNINEKQILLTKPKIAPILEEKIKEEPPKKTSFFNFLSIPSMSFLFFTGQTYINTTNLASSQFSPFPSKK